MVSSERAVRPRMRLEATHTKALWGAWIPVANWDQVGSVHVFNMKQEYQTYRDKARRCISIQHLEVSYGAIEAENCILGHPEQWLGPN